MRRDLSGRVALWVVLIIAWGVSVWYMWEAVATITPADRLDGNAALTIPTSRTFIAALAFSGMELAVVLAIIWPWRPELYGTRLAVGVLALATWITMAAATDLTPMDGVHRRWLAFMTVALASALMVLLLYRGARRVAHRHDAAPTL